MRDDLLPRRERDERNQASEDRRAEAEVISTQSCVDCGARIRANYSPPRCNVCLNRTKSRQRALEKRYWGRLGEAPVDPRRQPGAQERVLEIEHA